MAKLKATRNPISVTRTVNTENGGIQYSISMGLDFTLDLSESTKIPVSYPSRVETKNFTDDEKKVVEAFVALVEGKALAAGKVAAQAKCKEIGVTLES